MSPNKKPVSSAEMKPYGCVYDLVLNCGNVHDPRNFAIEILKGVQNVCWFDAASVYFKAPNGSVEDQYLLNTDEYWSNAYLNYYSSIENSRYGYNRAHFSPNQTSCNIRDWRHEQVGEFVNGLVRPRGLKYSLGFVLYDLNGCDRILFCLDRLENECFADNELTALSMSIPMLNNLHKNFYYQRQSRNEGVNRIVMEKANLTAREIQVANLLCQGMSPSNISKMLCITLATSYKHIAHIYEKMNISSRQELLAKLLG